ncbi:MAG: hypothetical protein JXL80_05420, partial [Planctomycetes bacterium]|nr:hypothetical protein [Planctomycetota bacterium]
MRKLLSVVLAVTGAVTMLGAGTAWANPVEGSYESEFTGVVLEGRWSESFLNGLPGQIGNTVHGASWDGAVLATQWELGDMAIDAAPTQLLNTVDGLGNGTIVWYTTYSGGGLILDKDGPWAPGGGEVADYSITLTHYAHTTQVVYVGGVA